ncbi:DoxX family protein [Paenibacillus sp. sptzw28]|uniref:DoxX family protein n=1 Tax=Paenibacillus sp. sptzw28 TaxID=715179 RepID=UPI001C6F131D|nr:DoxX family protein [Paenibacillus sp. sptzw28]QYR21242.1 DoxX family protein [Paenibacillus sp. sptzw28]
MMNWLRNSRVAAGLLTVLRLYVGWKFISAGWGKLTNDKPFDASGFMKGAIAKADGEKPVVQQWYGDFLQGFTLPNVDVFNFLVPWGEFLVGLTLITGTLTMFSAFMGIFMNFNFLFAGAISLNPNLILIQFFLLAAGMNAGRFGGDYWIIPWVRKYARALYRNEQSSAPSRTTNS